MATNIVSMIAAIANSANDASKPTAVLFGEVTAVNPLVIMVDQKIPLTEDFLILTDAVRDHWRDMTVDHLTENSSGGGGHAAFASHNHQYLGRKPFLIHNDLVVGEYVVLLRVQGGQKFVVLDRCRG